jgi:hypothetical protein
MVLNNAQKQVNELWLRNQCLIIKDGGFWIWADENEIFKLNNGKFTPLSQNGRRKLKEIVSKKWFEKNVN